MTSLKNIRSTVKEIIDLSSKSAVLADPKSKIFCKQYLKLEQNANNTEDSTFGFLKLLCKEHGLQTDRLYSNVMKLSLLKIV